MEKNKCPDCGKDFDSSDALNQHKEAKHSLPVEKARTTKKSIDTPKIIIYGLMVVLAAGAFYVLAQSLSSAPRMGSIGSTHTHMDFMIYIEGTPIDFSLPKYQLASQYVHAEEGIGTLIHKHATGVTLNDFLNTVGMGIDKDCFKADTGKKYCNGEGKTLKFYLNGKLTTPDADYDLRDLDKFLISYGNETDEQINQQLATITDLAKKESNKNE